MSHDISLNDPATGEPVKVPAHKAGGTVVAFSLPKNASESAMIVVRSMFPMLKDLPPGAAIPLQTSDGKPGALIAGTTDARMTVTYNYGPYYYQELDAELGLRWLDRKTARDTIGRLQRAVSVLGDTPDSDYWAKTPGNAGHALAVLLDWAQQYPTAVWSV